MIPALLLIFTFLAAIASLEIALKHSKLQSRVPLVLGVHVSAAIAVAGLLLYGYSYSPVSVFTFWIGAFATWFGVRSHVESSILLRMLYMMRDREVTRDELLAEYKLHYGIDLRIKELQRADLLETRSSGLAPTRKARWILRLADALDRKSRAPV